MSDTYKDLPFTSYPNSIQSFVTMQDILASDGPNVKGFQDAMEVGNIQLAQQFYNSITNANTKFVDAAKMNALFQTCVAVQRFYQNDVKPYTEQKQDEWQDIIDKFEYKGVWSNTTSYVENNWVSYDIVTGETRLFIALHEVPIGALPTNTDHWRMLTIQGVKGDSGVGLSFVGEWSAVMNYTANDAVGHLNGLWLALQANTNQEPSDNSVYWKLIYRSYPMGYPTQKDQPVGQNAGDLWFEVTD